MKISEIASSEKKMLPESEGSGNFQKVLDGRKSPIRGLWQRNNRFYARSFYQEFFNARLERLEEMKLSAAFVYSTRT